MKKIFSFHVPIIIALILIASLGLMSYDDTKDFETAKNLDIFYSLFTEISNSYVDELAPGDIMSRAITEMLKTLDPYTNFIPESDVEQYTMQSEKEFAGIGVSVVERNNQIVVESVFEHSPAHKAGIEQGDVIIEGDGHSTENLTLKDCLQFLQGEDGSTLQLIIARHGEQKKFSIVRGNVKTKSVPFYGMLDNEIGYVKLNEFSQNCSDDVRKACVSLLNSKAQGLILDLRDNPGGLLVEAVKIVNLFVPRGEKIVFTKGQNTTENHKFSTPNDPLNVNVPLVVLVNEHSASASEIVSGALQDLDRAVVIGRKTFGKGLVQNRKTLPHNCLLKITTAKYYIPSGRCIQKLQYNQRDEYGNPTVIADSLQRTFYTRNHRPVKDGGGIVPDIVLADAEVAEVVKNLQEHHLFFDYANANYSYADTVNITCTDFHLNDEDFSKFVEFCQNHDFSYKSKSEQMIDSFARYANEEHLLVQEELQALQSKIDIQQKQLFVQNKELILNELEKTIARKLFFETGFCQYSLRDDSFIEEAKIYLRDNDKYKNILGKIVNR